MTNIFVVDDEPAIRRQFRITLGPDRRIGEAGDGDAARRSLRSERWDLVVLDIAMPIMDGLAVCRAAR